MKFAQVRSLDSPKDLNWDQTFMGFDESFIISNCKLPQQEFEQ